MGSPRRLTVCSTRAVVIGGGRYSAILRGITTCLGLLGVVAVAGCGGERGKVACADVGAPLGTSARWDDSRGCPAPRTVLAEFTGPAHCGWEAASTIVTGIPIGTTLGGPTQVATYVKDPGNVYGDRLVAQAFSADAKLPATAVDTGLRRGDTELWTDPNDPSAIYLVDQRVERWPRDLTPASCD